MTKEEVFMSARKGFTLLELLVVVAILSILASIVGVAVLKEPGRQKVKIARVQMETLGMALSHYYLRHGFYPTQEQGLMALVKRPDAEPVPKDYPPEGYLDKRRLPLDPWGAEYVYIQPGRNDAPFEIVCYGSDSMPGGEGEAADISSLEP